MSSVQTTPMVVAPLPATVGQSTVNINHVITVNSEKKEVSPKNDGYAPGKYLYMALEASIHVMLFNRMEPNGINPYPLRQAYLVGLAAGTVFELFRTVCGSKNKIGLLERADKFAEKDTKLWMLLEAALLGPGLLGVAENMVKEGPNHYGAIVAGGWAFAAGKDLARGFCQIPKIVIGG